MVLAALAVRLGPTLAAGALRGPIGYDESVHFFGAEHLVNGRLPYRDFLFLHPAGVLLILAPLAALGRFVGDSWMLATARLVWMTVGAADAGLVAVLLRRYGLVPAAAGGLLYAVWLTPADERQLKLEPLLNLALLLGLVLLRRADRSARATALAGMVLGISATVKVWAVLSVAVLAVLVLLTYGVRRCSQFTLAAAGTAFLLCLPWLLLTPGTFWHDVVSVQVGRDRDPPTLVRLAFLVLPSGSLGAPGLATHPAEALIAAALVVVLGLPVAAGVLALARRRRLDPQAPDVWWAALAAAQLLFLAVTPSFFYYYVAFAAPALCLTVVATAIRLGGPRWGRVAGPAAVLALVVLATRPAVTGPIGPGRVDKAALARFADAHRCIWAADATPLLLADAGDTTIARGCPLDVDPFGEELVLGAGRAPTVPEARTIAAWQARVRTQLADSDAAVLVGRPEDAAFDVATLAAFHARFRLVGVDGPYTLWSAG